MGVLDTIGDVVTAPVDAFNKLGEAGRDIGRGLNHPADSLNADQKAKLSAVLARNGWGPPTSATNRMARSVVKRESEADPTAKNKSGATGLFQMMTPLHCGSYGIPKDDCVHWLEDPDNNAKAAHALFVSNGWTPWVSSGPVPPPLASATYDPVITTDKDDLGDTVKGVTSPFGSVVAAAVDLIGVLLSPDTWFRIGKTWLGLVLIILGSGALVYIIANAASNGATGRAVKGAAAVAATVK